MRLSVLNEALDELIIAEADWGGLPGRDELLEIADTPEDALDDVKFYKEMREDLEVLERGRDSREKLEIIPDEFKKSYARRARGRISPNKLLYVYQEALMKNIGIFMKTLARNLAKFPELKDVYAKAGIT